jgi:Tfp pilus assembly protein PilZ
MGALHAIERSQGTQLVPHAEVALINTRTALSQLQNQPPTFEAVTHAMEAVAASLASVHALSRMALPHAPTAVQTAQPMQQPAPQAVPQPQHPAAQPLRQPPPAPFAGQQPSYGAPQAAPVQPQAQPQRLSAPQAPAAAYARDPFASPAKPAAAAAMSASSLHPPSPPAAANAAVVSADLGTQSPTNFYKGLSGNDIIEHGGLFVSTYMIPPIGSNVRLKISLPGGYEFEANAVVRWAREASDDGAAPPGFGAQFTQITPEARQLVYRYTRNREPLFHDDM